jgi:hypothetical protein
MYTGTKLDKSTYSYTYDYITTVDLTEDRTIKDTWSLRHHISRLWLECMTEDFLKQHLPHIAKERMFENQLSNDYCTPTEAFINACAYLNKFHQPMPLWHVMLTTNTAPLMSKLRSTHLIATSE